MDIKNIEQLVDTKVLQFGQMCSGYNVNDLSVLKSMLGLALGEINFKMNEIISFRHTNINMTDGEYSQFVTQIVSMGGLISNINSKLEVVDYYFEDLTPSCFKK